MAIGLSVVIDAADVRAIKSRLQNVIRKSLPALEKHWRYIFSCHDPLTQVESASQPPPPPHPGVATIKLQGRIGHVTSPRFAVATTRNNDAATACACPFPVTRYLKWSPIEVLVGPWAEVVSDARKEVLKGLLIEGVPIFPQPGRSSASYLPVLEVYSQRRER